MGKKIGYAKLGRSMTLNGLEDCGTLGGDVEMVPPIKTLAERHPEDTFYLVGRNTCDTVKVPGLPDNVVNLWFKPIKDDVRRRLNSAGLNHANLSVDDQMRVRDIYDEITQDWFTDLDGMVIWSGQHGTTNSPIPKIKQRHERTKPYDWCAYYVSYLIRGINHWRDQSPLTREEIWLNADPRNYLKARDLKWPLHNPVLAQFNYENNTKHYRWGDGWANEWNRHFDVHDSTSEPGVVESNTRNVYSRLEINGLTPGTPFGDLVSYHPTWENRDHFGLFINEARKEVTKSRLTAMQMWVNPLNPAWVHGKWSDASQVKLGRIINPAPWAQYYPKLHSVRCTLTTPSSGSGWATTKPWEAFAAGTVCFFHPDYDVQDNILGDAPEYLRNWLRVKTPEELLTRVNHLNTQAGRSDWQILIETQRTHFENAMADLTYMKHIENRLYGGEA